MKSYEEYKVQELIQNIKRLIFTKVICRFVKRLKNINYLCYHYKKSIFNI